MPDAAELPWLANQAVRRPGPHGHRHRPRRAGPELPDYRFGGAYYLPEEKVVIVVMANSDLAADKGNPAPTIMRTLTAAIAPGTVMQ